VLSWLILLFVTVPLAELALLVWVGGKVGLGATVALVIVTGVLGASLARWQGLATLARFQGRLAAGELPHEDMIDGILILVAGAVLLTPGLITDAAGFLLLVPGLRRALRRRLARRFAARLVVARPAGAAGAPPRRRRPDSGDIVDAEFEVKD
jgi:UPF0716 protein FxsA